MTLWEAAVHFAANPPLALILGGVSACAIAFAALRLAAEPHAPVRQTGSPNAEVDLVSRTMRALERERYSVVIASLTERLSRWCFHRYGRTLDQVPGWFSARSSPHAAAFRSLRGLRSRLDALATRAFRLEVAWYPRWDFFRPLPAARAGLLARLPAAARSVDAMTSGGAP